MPSVQSQDLLGSVLNYEDECFEGGFQEGLDAGKVQGHIEGRELGIQTGFQRYRSLGILQGRLEVWQRDPPEKKEKALVKLQELLEVSDYDNDPKLVDDLELRIRKAKATAKIIAVGTQSPAINAHDNKIVYQKDDSNIEDL